MAIAGAGLISSWNSSNAASDASDAQIASGERSLAEQRRQFDLTREDTRPWRETGGLANDRLRYLLGLGNQGSGQSSNAPSRSYDLGSRPGYNAPQSGQYGRLFDGIGSSYTAPRLNDGIGSGYYAPRRPTSDALPYGNEGVPPFPNRSPGLIDAGPVDANGNPISGPYAQQPMGNAPQSGEFGSLLRPFGAGDMYADPVYNSGFQFGLDEGRNAVNARAIAGGGYDSGATLKALTRYGNDYASTKANDSYNRYNTNQGNIFNRLSGISGTGQTAVGQVTAAGQNSTNAISEILMGQGNARAAGIVGGSNAWGSGAQGLSNAWGNYQSNQTLQRLLGGGGGYPYVNEQATGQYSLNDPAYG